MDDTGILLIVGIMCLAMGAGILAYDVFVWVDTYRFNKIGVNMEGEIVGYEYGEVIGYDTDTPASDTVSIMFEIDGKQRTVTIGHELPFTDKRLKQGYGMGVRRMIKVLRTNKKYHKYRVALLREGKEAVSYAKGVGLLVPVAFAWVLAWAMFMIAG